MKNRRFYLILAIIVAVILLYRFIASAYFIGKKAGIDQEHNRCVQEQAQQNTSQQSKYILTYRQV